MKKVVENSVKLGRKVNPNSVRQIRLKELEMKKELGLLKRGRPVVENSERQIRLKKQLENKLNGVKQGRPVNPNSERQKRLNELNMKRELGLVKRGRPSKVVTDEVAA